VASLTERFDIQDPHLARSARGWELEGAAPCYGAKKDAADAAARWLGVRSIVNRLRVVSESSRSDRELAAAVRAVLAERPRTRGHAIAVDTRLGCVTLRGTVRSRAARVQAEIAVWSVRGVTKVMNLLEAADQSETDSERRARTA
jgi:osmotically-inducible protein OsmY